MQLIIKKYILFNLILFEIYLDYFNFLTGRNYI